MQASTSGHFQARKQFQYFLQATGNNNFGAHIEAYKNLLQKTAEKIEMLVMRDNRPIILYLKVGRIR
jgi:hypothetical protein